MNQEVQGDSCVLRENCHDILQKLGYNDDEIRNSLIKEVKEATRICSSAFPSSDILKIVKEWKGTMIII